MPEPSHAGPIAVVLAAGQGKRMRSALPKVLHRAAGRPLLAWVLSAARAAGCERFVVIVGHGAEQVKADPEVAAVRHEIEAAGGSFDWALQEQQLGTGHALLQAEAACGDGSLLVLSGDVPLVAAATLRNLLAVAAAAGNWGAMAVAELADPGSLGRVIAGAGGGDGGGGSGVGGGSNGGAGGGGGGGGVGGGSNGGAGNGPLPEADWLVRIVEAADASPAERAITMINAGLYVLPAPAIFDNLRRLAPLAPNNAQGEIYLTDAVGAAAAAGRRVALVRLADAREALGVNDRRELAAAQRILIDRHLDALMQSGVHILEPARTAVEPVVRVGADTVLHPEVSLSGRTEIGAGCILEQGVWVRDSRVGPGVNLGPYCVLDGATVAPGRRLAPLTVLAPASHSGGGNTPRDGNGDDGGGDHDGRDGRGD